MAEKRMINKSIIDSDLFLEMPLSTQALYFHLILRADDDGFVSNPKKIMRMIGVDDESIRILISKSYIIPFESGVIVIKHWRVHNCIQKDRYKETIYLEEKQQLDITNNVYDCAGNLETACIQTGSKMDPTCIQNGSKMDTDCIHRLDKIRLDKINNIYIRSKNDEILLEFETLWKQYPKKQGKKEALKAYQKARNDKKNPVTFEEVLKGLENYNAYIKANNIGEQYIKHGSTWFNQQSWSDEYGTGNDQNTDISKYNVVINQIP